jgi:hypothetical protein
MTGRLAASLVAEGRPRSGLTRRLPLTISQSKKIIFQTECGVALIVSFFVDRADRWKSSDLTGGE